MKIIHTADIHLGRKFTKLGEKAGEQRQLLRDAFTKVVDLACADDVDLLLIAGDLFDSNKVSKAEIEFAREQFEKLASHEKWVCISHGTHDANDGLSVLNRDKFLNTFNNVILFDNKKQSHNFPHLDLTVYGISNSANKGKDDPLAKVQKDDKAKYHIAMIHGSVAIESKHAPDDWPIDPEKIKNSELNYIALGHWHSTQDMSQGKVQAWYAGAPESIDYDEKGGNALEVSITDKETKVKEIKVGQRNFDKIEIDVAEFADYKDLKKAMIKGANKNLARQIILKGLVGPEKMVDKKMLQEELAANFYQVNIDIKNLHLDIDNINEKDYPEELVIGQYVRALKKELSSAKNDEEKAILEKALHKGVALLSGKEIL
ncbi:MAG: DNA repair exonuclease [bacterium]